MNLSGRHRRDELLAEAAGAGQFHQLVHRLRRLRQRVPDGRVELRQYQRPFGADEDHEYEGPDGSVKYL